MHNSIYLCIPLQAVIIRQWSHKAADWSADYLNTIAQRPVRAQTAPGDILKSIATSPPEHPEDMATIFDDFKTTIPDGMTHWQHPRFFAYFPSNAAPAAVIAEQLAGALASQCMLWQTSPAATELETAMIDWLRQATGLPEEFSGSFQDAASSATLCAVLTMRERALNWEGNRQGLSGHPRLRVYASSRTHSSIDKAMWVAGLGQENLVKIPTDSGYAMRTDVLAERIKEDRANGYLPVGVVACVGGTSMGATDKVGEVVSIAHAEDLYVHVDAAWAGSAMICPEYRHMWQGVECADSVVLNPHKWLGAPIECSAHFVRDPDTMIRTLSLQPEYLKTHGHDGIINYSEWSVQLGRRFRALKVWFLLRAYGLEGLRKMIRNHVAWTAELAKRFEGAADFEVVTQPILALFTFRYASSKIDDLNALNLELVNAINDDGRIYLTQTDHDGTLVIRFSCGQFETTEADVMSTFDVVRELAEELVANRL